MWEAQWTPFFPTSFATGWDASVVIQTGREAILPPIEVWQVWEISTGPWTPPERRIVIPWNDSWLDITKLNLPLNRG